MTNLTKEEIGDLKSHINRLIECEMMLERAKQARENTQRALDGFLHSLQFLRAKKDSVSA